jgi:hypothetical protein
MSTATEIGMMQRETEMRKRGFEQRMEHFINEWAPEDNRFSRAAFETELIVLVREIYADAQAPLLDHITKIVMAMPWPPTIGEKK